MPGGVGRLVRSASRLQSAAHRLRLRSHPMADDPQNSETVTIGVELGSADWKLRTKIAAPAGPTRLVQLLPLAHALADAITGMAVRGVEKQGEKISCKKGCGACCR